MAGVFAGTFSHSLDGKGRVIIPACYREGLGESFTVALNSSIEALALYPAGKWEAINERLSRVKDTDDEGMDYVRYIMSYAIPDTTMDAQGRVLLPAPIRSEVGLERDVTFVGLRDHIEIWDTETFKAKERSVRERFSQLRRHVNELD